jgi:hypothetical protein
VRFGLDSRGGESPGSSRSGGSGVRIAARPAITLDQYRESVLSPRGTPQNSKVEKWYPSGTGTVEFFGVDSEASTVDFENGSYPDLKGLQTRSKSVSCLYSLRFFLKLYFA